MIASFGSVNRVSSPSFKEGFERHHIIARQCLRDPVLGPFLASIEEHGFAVHDFATNGVLLPALPTLAEHTGLPLHRGPHPHYNSAVMAQIDEVRRAALWIDGTERRGRFAVRALRVLQVRLRAKIASRTSRTVDAIRLCDRPHMDLDAAVDRFLALKKSATPQGRTPQP
ncbi:MAG: AHH domain-containing protein [Sphingomonadaceae bacterium]